MKIYAQEVSDGLKEVLENNSTIAYAAPALAYTPSDSETKKIKGFIQSQGENKDQLDLYYLSSVLVSTGWNKNDDVFDGRETWTARKTPEDKQFNFMHDESDIIGHITGNYIVDFDGNPIDENVEDIPTDFNIITTAVLYTSWGDIDLKTRMNTIIEEIQEGDKWFVSMECLFPSFDYALVDSQGNTKIVKREDASAFLTKHLRAYGGTGRYDGYAVGRLLRDISFSGKGLVSKPANPRSVILQDTKRFNETESRLVSVSSIKENKMSDILEKQVDELKAELAEARAYNEKMQAEMEQKKEEAVQAQIESFGVAISEKDEVISALESQIAETNTKVAELEEAVTAITSAKDEAIAEVAEIKKAAALEKRVAALTEAGLEGEELDEAIAKLENLDQETFDFIVAQMSKAAGKPPWLDKDKKKKDEDKEKEKDDATHTMKKGPKTGPHYGGVSDEHTAEEIDQAEADEEVLESVEADEDVALAEAVDGDDKAEDLRASASNWFGSLLKSTANIQE